MRRPHHSAAVLVLGVIGLCVSATPATAQAGGGVKGGLAWVSFQHSGGDEEVEALAGRADFVVGGFLFGPISSPVSAEVEALVGRRGAQLNFFETRVDFELWYVDVSGLIRGTIARGRSAQAYLLAGVTTGLLIKAELVTREAGQEVDRTDLGGSLCDVDVRLLVGAGVDVGRLVLEGRYAHGLRSIVQNPEAGTAALSLKNRAVELLVGIRF